MLAKNLVALVALLSAVGCASVSVTPVTNSTGSVGKSMGATDSGVRFYRPALYVWLTAAAPPDKVNISTVARVTKGPGRVETEKKSKETSGGGTKEAESLEKASTAGTQETTQTDVVSTVASSYTASIVVLPDYTQEYVIEWDSGLGSVTPSFTLTDGWNLTAFESAVDSKASELITSLGGLAGGGLLAAQPNFRGAGLYKIDISATGEFSLGSQVMPLQ